MSYPIEPDLIVDLSDDEHAALARIAEEVLDDDASAWLKAMPAAEDGSPFRRCRFGDLYDYLTGFITRRGIEDEIRAGSVSEGDAALYAGVLSHCLQRHVRVDDVLSGNAKRIISGMG